MIKIPVGMIIKQIIDEKRLKGKEVADKMGVSRQSIYQSYAKQELSDGEMTRWADALGVTKEEMIKRWESAITGTPNNDASNIEPSAYLMEHLTNLEEQFQRLLTQLDTKDKQLEVKDRQIEKLMDLLGKLDPASEESKVKELWPKRLATA
jgi:transcriptional regulator with XRE-family HTH domain